jgi:hypothetical protein
MKSLKVCIIIAFSAAIAGSGFAQDKTPADALKTIKQTSVNMALNKSAALLQKWIPRLEIGGSLNSKTDENFHILTVQPLYESDSLSDTIFMQGSVFGYDGRHAVNLGIGYRRLAWENRLLLGVNGFYDHEFPYDHARSSIGVEFRSSVFEINSNKYFAETGYKTDEDGTQSRTLPGHDIEFGLTVPYLNALTVFGKRFVWEAFDNADDTKGDVLSIRGKFGGLEIEAGYTDYTAGGLKDEKFVKLAYTIPLGAQNKSDNKKLIADKPWSFSSMEGHRLDKVRRENKIFKQKKFSVSVGGF